VDGSRIRKEKVADSKISGYVWTGPKANPVTCRRVNPDIFLFDDVKRGALGTRVNPHTIGYVWIGEFDLNTLRVDGEIFESGKKKLRIQKYRIRVDWALVRLRKPQRHATLQEISRQDLTSLSLIHREILAFVTVLHLSAKLRLLI